MKTVSEPAIGNIARAFLRLGLTAFGGLAMVEPMRQMAVDKQGCLSQEVVGMLALATLQMGQATRPDVPDLLLTAATSIADRF
jgi:hypothetical protein